MHGTTTSIRPSGRFPDPQVAEPDPAWRPWVRLLDLALELGQLLGDRRRALVQRLGHPGEGPAQGQLPEETEPSNLEHDACLSSVIMTDHHQESSLYLMTPRAHTEHDALDDPGTAKTS